MVDQHQCRGCGRIVAQNANKKWRYEQLGFCCSYCYKRAYYIDSDTYNVTMLHSQQCIVRNHEPEDFPSF